MVVRLGESWKLGELHGVAINVLGDLHLTTVMVSFWYRFPSHWPPGAGLLIKIYESKEEVLDQIYFKLR